MHLQAFSVYHARLPSYCLLLARILAVFLHSPAFFQTGLYSQHIQCLTLASLLSHGLAFTAFSMSHTRQPPFSRACTRSILNVSHSPAFSLSCTRQNSHSSVTHASLLNHLHSPGVLLFTLTSLLTHAHQPYDRLTLASLLTGLHSPAFSSTTASLLSSLSHTRQPSHCLTPAKLLTVSHSPALSLSHSIASLTATPSEFSSSHCPVSLRTKLLPPWKPAIQRNEYSSL